MASGGDAAPAGQEKASTATILTVDDPSEVVPREIGPPTANPGHEESRAVQTSEDSSRTVPNVEESSQPSPEMIDFC